MNVLSGHDDWLMATICQEPGFFHSTFCRVKTLSAWCSGLGLVRRGLLLKAGLFWTMGWVTTNIFIEPSKHQPPAHLFSVALIFRQILHWLQLAKANFPSPFLVFLITLTLFISGFVAKKFPHFVIFVHTLLLFTCEPVLHWTPRQRAPPSTAPCSCSWGRKGAPQPHSPWGWCTLASHWGSRWGSTPPACYSGGHLPPLRTATPPWNEENKLWHIDAIYSIWVNL